MFVQNFFKFNPIYKSFLTLTTHLFVYQNLIINYPTLSFIYQQLNLISLNYLKEHNNIGICLIWTTILNMNHQQTELEISFIKQTSNTSFKDQVLSQTHCFNQRKSPFINFNKTLKVHQDGTMKKYNTNAKTYLEQKTSSNKQRYETINKQRQQFYQKFYQKFMPEPWEHESQPFDGQNKQFLTQILDNNKKKANLSKSIYVSLGKYQKINNKLKNFRSTSSVQPCQNKQPTINNNMQDNGMKSSLSQYDQKDYIISQNFRYNNQQKARVSLQLMVHKKKHKKMSKILKIKTRCFDKTVSKQDKINHHSKFLVEALDKLSSDNFLKKSINCSVQVFEKRSISSYKMRCKTDQNSFNSQLKSNKWLSSKKFKIGNETFKQSSLRSYINYPINKSEPQFQVTIPVKTTAQNQRCKVSFKPKRNQILETKNKITSRSKIQVNQIRQFTNSFLITNHRPA